jgi:hypothetical protein
MAAEIGVQHTLNTISDELGKTARLLEQIRKLLIEVRPVRARRLFCACGADRLQRYP